MNTTPLPLHPRRAQQLFQEILLKNSNLTPSRSKKSLSERLLHLQQLNMNGIQQVKRKSLFKCLEASTASNSHSESKEVTLQVTKDGSFLEIASQTCSAVVSVQLLHVKAIILYNSPPHSFSLQLSKPSSDRNMTTDACVDPVDVFIAPTADIFNRWIVALTCGINAFQQQQFCNFPDAKAADLVWQAVRLRVFELAEVMALPTAIEHVTSAVPPQEYQQSEALRRRVRFFQNCYNAWHSHAHADGSKDSFNYDLKN